MTIPLFSPASHTLCRKEGSGDATTVDLLPPFLWCVFMRYNLRRAQISLVTARVVVDCICCYGAAITSCVSRISASYHLTIVFDNYIPRQQLISCSMTRSSTSVKAVACKTNLHLALHSNSSHRLALDINRQLRHFPSQPLLFPPFQLTSQTPSLTGLRLAMSPAILYIITDPHILSHIHLSHTPHNRATLSHIHHSPTRMVTHTFFFFFLFFHVVEEDKMAYTKKDIPRQ